MVVHFTRLKRSGKQDLITATAAENQRWNGQSPKIGFDQLLPVDGAFYIYANTSRFSPDSMEFTRAMLHESGVAATPGLDFDPMHGKEYTRFSFAGAHEDMKRALVQLKNWLG